MRLKAQVSLFVTIGLVLLLFVSLIIYYSVEKTSYGLSLDTGSPNYFVSSCLKKSAFDAVTEMGKLGGRTSAPMQINTLLPFSEVEKQLSSYIETNIELCIDNLSLFRKSGYDVLIKKPVVVSKVNANQINFDLHYDIKLSKGDSVLNLNDFKYTFKEVYLIEIYNVTSELLSSDEWYNLSDLDNKKKDLFFYSNKTKFYAVSDAKITFNFSEE